MLQNELTTALSQVEQLSIVAERSRIFAGIHNNAGHEIVASYITFQTVRKVMGKDSEKALELLDKSMNSPLISLFFPARHVIISIVKKSKK